MRMAVTIRNRHTSGSSSHRSAASFATRLSAKVSTKVRSLVSKYEFFNQGTGSVQNQPQYPRSKQRRSTIASVRQALDHDRVPTSKASLVVDEDEEEDFPMRPDITHVFSNVEIGQPKRRVVKRCASMFYRLSQIHTFNPLTKRKSPQLLEEPKVVIKRKVAMLGGVKALIKVFNSQPDSTDMKPIVDGPKSTRPQSSSVDKYGDTNFETLDNSYFNSNHSLVSTHGEFYAISRSSSTLPLARRRVDPKNVLNESQRHSRCLQPGNFADFNDISASHEGCPPIATLPDLDTLSSPTIEQLSSVPPPPKPEGPLSNRLSVSVSTQSFTSMLFRVNRNHVTIPIGNQNNQDVIASCTSCTSCTSYTSGNLYQYESCPCAGPSSKASRSASTNTSSYKPPVLQARRPSRGDFSTSSSESASTPQSEIELRRKGSPLTESYLATRRDKMERFEHAMSAPRPGFPNGYWDLALRIVTEGDDDFYDESSDEGGNEKEEDIGIRTFHTGIRKALRKQSGRVDSQDAGRDGKAYISGTTSSLCSLEPLSQVISAPSFFGCGYGSEIYDSEYYAYVGDGPDGRGNLPGNGDPESAETCRDMPLGEIIQLLGRSVSLDQNIAPKRIRIPVHGLPPTKVMSPKPDMYRNTTKDIRHMVFRWS